MIVLTVILPAIALTGVAVVVAFTIHMALGLTFGSSEPAAMDGADSFPDLYDRMIIQEFRDLGYREIEGPK